MTMASEVHSLAKWTSETRPPENVISKVLYYMKRVNRPIYMGAVAIEYGYAIRQTQWVMDALEQEGRVRQLTAPEKHKLGMELISVVYVLVKEKPD